MKIGIFGGAFNPPHKEHINMIKQALLSGLDEVVLVPSKNPPHKSTCTVDFSHRVNMLNIALLGVKNVCIDDIENRDDSIHYTYQILPKLKEKYKDIVFIIGGDSLVDFHKWKNPEEIIKICPLMVFHRGNDDIEFNEAKKYWENKGANIEVVDYIPSDVSSSLIRHYLYLGYRGLVDEKVEHYIDENGLYNDYISYIQKLSTMIKRERLEHSIRTAKYALYLNDRHKLGIDLDKVLLAGLLHDCGKGREKDDSIDKSMLPKDSIGSKVEHQFLGAVFAKDIFNVQDENILNAIKYHCTGKGNMSTFEKLIYSADLLEEGREDDFIPVLRKKMDENFEEGFKTIVENQYNYLKTVNEEKDIYYLTKECYNFYIKG